MKEISFAELLELPNGTIFSPVEIQYVEDPTDASLFNGGFRSSIPVSKKLTGVFRKVRNAELIPQEDAVYTDWLVNGDFSIGICHTEGADSSFVVLEGNDPCYPVEYQTWYEASLVAKEGF